jgi:hypothetical protein
VKGASEGQTRLLVQSYIYPTIPAATSLYQGLFSRQLSLCLTELSVGTYHTALYNTADETLNSTVLWLPYLPKIPSGRQNERQYYQRGHDPDVETNARSNPVSDGTQYCGITT